MEGFELQGVKRANIVGVFDAVARRGAASRADIAEDTGLSLMTVGKVADAFKQAGLFLEEKEGFRQSAGRRPGRLSLRRDIYSVVLDISERNFCLHIVNFALETQDMTSFTYNREFYYGENLHTFLKRAQISISSASAASPLYGVGVVVPGNYDASLDTVTGTRIAEFGTLKLREQIEDTLGTSVDIIMKNSDASALSYAYDHEDSKTIVSLFIGEGINGSVLCNGAFVDGARGGVDIGSMLTVGTGTLGERLSLCTNDNAKGDELAHALYNIISFLGPDAVVVECPSLRVPDYFINRVERTLSEKYGLAAERMPEFYMGKGSRRHSVRGAAAEMRKAWLDKNL